MSEPSVIKGVTYVVERGDCPNANMYKDMFGKSGWPGLIFNKATRYNDAVLFTNKTGAGLPEALLGYHEKGDLSDPFFWDDEFGPDWIQEFAEMVGR